MKQQTLIGVGLGVVAAVVFASASTGPMLLRYLMFLLTALPVFLAALGWGWRTGAIAALTGTVLIGLLGAPIAALLFAAGQAVPAVWLSYLALLNRPAEEASGRETDTSAAAAAGVQWYPSGRLVLWAAALASALTVGVALIASQDFDKFKSDLRSAISETLKARVSELAPDQKLDDATLAQVTDAAIALMPAATSITLMSALVFNLWLAGKITRASGQLLRPWPSLDLLTYPRGVSIAFVAALLASGVAGLPGAAGTGIAGALYLALVFLGLAVLHYSARDKSWRAFALGTLYAGLLIGSVWVSVAVALLGLADGVFDLRRRFAGATGPPP